MNTEQEIENEKDRIKMIILREANRIPYQNLIMRFEAESVYSRTILDTLMEQMLREGDIYEPVLGRMGVVL